MCFAVCQADTATRQALAERGESALQHRDHGVGRAAADLLADALDLRAQASCNSTSAASQTLGLLDPAAAANWVDVVGRTVGSATQALRLPEPPPRPTLPYVQWSEVEAIDDAGRSAEAAGWFGILMR